MITLLYLILRAKLCPIDALVRPQGYKLEDRQAECAFAEDVTRRYSYSLCIFFLLLSRMPPTVSPGIIISHLMCCENSQMISLLRSCVCKSLFQTSGRVSPLKTQERRQCYSSELSSIPRLAHCHRALQLPSWRAGCLLRACMTSALTAPRLTCCFQPHRPPHSSSNPRAMLLPPLLCTAGPPACSAPPRCSLCSNGSLQRVFPCAQSSSKPLPRRGFLCTAHHCLDLFVLFTSF